MMLKRVRLLMLQLFAVGIVFAFSFENVHASEHDEASSEDVSVGYPDEYVIESSGEVLSEDSNDVEDEIDSSDVTDEELDSEVSSSPSVTPSGSTVIVQQDNDDSAVRALLNAFMERKDTLNGFEKQVLNRLDVLSVGCIIIVAVVAIRLFF